MLPFVFFAGRARLFLRLLQAPRPLHTWRHPAVGMGEVVQCSHTVPGSRWLYTPSLFLSHTACPAWAGGAGEGDTWLIVGTEVPSTPARTVAKAGNQTGGCILALEASAEK